MKKVLLPIVTAIGIFVGGFAASLTISESSNNYAYAGEFGDSQDGQNTEENQTDNSNNNGDNNIQGISGDSSSNSQKKIKDKTAPTVTSVKPNYGTVGIPLDTNVEATFSEPVKDSSVTDSTFKLENGADGTPVLDDISLSDDGTITTLTPSSPLSASTSYKATISTDIEDLAGNGIASDETWSFTTGEGAPTTNNSPDAADTSSSDNGIISKQQSDIVMQSMQDDALVERIFPLIVNKLDGATILKKVDGQQLLEKVLPYLDIKLLARTQLGDAKNVGVTGLKAGVQRSDAHCNAGEIPSGGGFDSNADTKVLTPSVDGWYSISSAATDYHIQAVAQCLKIEVGIKSIEASQAPGGSPLLPP